MREYTKNFQDKLKDKFSGGNRPDLAIADHRKVSEIYKVAIAFDREVGKPSKTEIRAFFELKFPELKPVLDTALVIGNAVIVFANPKTETRPYSDAKKLQPIVAIEKEEEPGWT